MNIPCCKRRLLPKLLWQPNYGKVNRMTLNADNQHTRPLQSPDNPLFEDDDDDLDFFDDEFANLERPLPKWSIQLMIADHSVPVQLNIQGKTVIGRADPDTHYTPNIDLQPYGGLNKGVSRRHAEILATESRLVLIDLGSTNGTFINGTRLRPNESYRLHHGDDVQIGGLNMKLHFSMVPFHEGVMIVNKNALEIIQNLRNENDKDIRRILVAESDADVASMFAALLQTLGYHVIMVNRTGDAMREISRKQPHAVFLDAGLKDLPPIDICRMLRTDMATRNLPIFFMSHDVNQETIKTIMEAGADMFLSKPVGLDQLLNALNKFVGEAQPRVWEFSKEK